MPRQVDDFQVYLLDIENDRGPAEYSLSGNKIAEKASLHSKLMAARKKPLTPQPSAAPLPRGAVLGVL